MNLIAHFYGLTFIISVLSKQEVCDNQVTNCLSCKYFDIE